MKSRLLDSRLHDQVIDLLTSRPDLRDSDSYLIAVVWHQEATDKGIDLKNITGLELLKLIRDGSFTSTESIQRSRRKAQEHHAELRGKRYGERKGKEVLVREYFNGN